MYKRMVVLSVTLIILLKLHSLNSYKSTDELKKQYKKYEVDNKYNTADVLVGKAMDFMYSNKTIMNLLARELWNVGATALDKIVKIGGAENTRKAEKRIETPNTESYKTIT